MRFPRWPRKPWPWGRTVGHTAPPPRGRRRPARSLFPRPCPPTPYRYAVGSPRDTAPLPGRSSLATTQRGQVALPPPPPDGLLLTPGTQRTGPLKPLDGWGCRVLEPPASLDRTEGVRGPGPTPGPLLGTRSVRPCFSSVRLRSWTRPPRRFLIRGNPCSKPTASHVRSCWIVGSRTVSIGVPPFARFRRPATVRVSPRKHRYPADAECAHPAYKACPAQSPSPCPSSRLRRRMPRISQTGSTTQIRASPATKPTAPGKFEPLIHEQATPPSPTTATAALHAASIPPPSRIRSLAAARAQPPHNTTAPATISHASGFTASKLRGAPLPARVECSP